MHISWNWTCANGLVKKSARFSLVDTYFTWMVPVSCCSLVYLNFTSMCLVRLWEDSSSASLMADWLSSHRSVERFWGICRSSRRLQRQTVSVVALYIAKYSATVVKVAIVGCFLEHHTTRQELMKKQKPVVLFLSGEFAQSESTYQLSTSVLLLGPG